MTRYFPLALAVVFASQGVFAGDGAFRVERSTVLTSTGEFHWAQSRAALIPGNPARVVVTTQQTDKLGSHGYRDVFFTETTDGAKTWSEPQRIASLAWARSANGQEPETGLDLTGGFAPVDVSQNETWVISSEMAFPKERSSEPNHVLLAKIIWANPPR